MTLGLGLASISVRINGRWLTTHEPGWRFSGGAPPTAGVAGSSGGSGGGDAGGQGLASEVAFDGFGVRLQGLFGVDLGASLPELTLRVPRRQARALPNWRTTVRCGVMRVAWCCQHGALACSRVLLPLIWHLLMHSILPAFMPCSTAMASIASAGASRAAAYSFSARSQLEVSNTIVEPRTAALRSPNAEEAAGQCQLHSCCLPGVLGTGSISSSASNWLAAARWRLPLCAGSLQRLPLGRAEHSHQGRRHRYEACARRVQSKRSAHQDQAVAQHPAGQLLPPRHSARQPRHDGPHDGKEACSAAWHAAVQWGDGALERQCAGNRTPGRRGRRRG